MVAFWLGFGLVYVVFRSSVNEDTRIAAITLGELAEIALLIPLWPVEVLGLSIQI
ncbi:MAG: hypothetical protein ACRDPT_03550 [Streptomycetales bacterium]